MNSCLSCRYSKEDDLGMAGTGIGIYYCRNEKSERYREPVAADHAGHCEKACKKWEKDHRPDYYKWPKDKTLDEFPF